MIEAKEHYKMYKSGKQWCAVKITTIAGVALFSTMILEENANANADSVNSSSVAQVTSKPRAKNCGS